MITAELRHLNGARFRPSGQPKCTSTNTRLAHTHQRLRLRRLASFNVHPKNPGVIAVSVVLEHLGWDLSQFRNCGGCNSNFPTLCHRDPLTSLGRKRWVSWMVRLCSLVYLQPKLPMATRSVRFFVILTSKHIVLHPHYIVYKLCE